MVEQMLIDQQSLSELIANKLKKKICNKELPLGQQLIETELEQPSDGSRSTIRDAFKILVLDGLLVGTARKGTYITTFTTKDVEEITELRMMIESRAFIHALPHMGDEDFQHLTTLTKQMKQTAIRKIGMLYLI